MAPAFFNRIVGKRVCPFLSTEFLNQNLYGGKIRMFLKSVHLN